MQSPTLKALTAALLIASAGQILWANETNPYATIVDRNPFGLKPPPPPPPPPETTAPPVPMAKVTLTGLLSTFGEPRALFEIIEEPGKGGGTAKKPILREGERLGPVEVLAIDVVKNSVRIRNSGVETNVTFEVVKSGPAAGGPGVPGAAPPPAFTPPPALQTSLGHPGSSGPTVISPNGANAGGGVTLVGGGGGAASPAVNTASLPGALGASSGNMGASYAGGGATPGATPIPPRPLRTGAETASAEGMPPMTRDQAALLREIRNMEGKGPPLPPSHLSQDFNNEVNGQQPPSGPPAFPQFPQKRR